MSFSWVLITENKVIIIRNRGIYCSKSTREKLISQIDPTENQIEDLFMEDK